MVMNKIYNYPTKQTRFFEKADAPDEGIITRNWGLLHSLTINEARYLSLGVNPCTAHLFWEDHTNWQNENVQISSDRIVEIKRAVYADVIRRVAPSSEVNDDTLLYALDLERYFNGANEKPEIKTLISETERMTFLKLILGMAIDKYNYNPKIHRNSATGGNKGSIRNALQTISSELDVNEDTIRKYLTEASEFFTLNLIQLPTKA